MSKSHKRVVAALEASGVEFTLRHEEDLTRTAVEAAAAAGCAVDQIAKSIIWKGGDSGKALLFITAGGRRVDEARAESLAGEPLLRADAAFIRETTGFAIGGVSPVGHIAEVRAWIDAELMKFDVIWAAAGTPRDNFAISPADLEKISGAQVSEFSS